MGVQTSQGYTADSDSMSARAGVIEEAASEAGSEVDDVGPTELSAADFGRAHTRWYEGYSTGIARLGAGAVEMCTTLGAFAARVGAVGEQYRQADEQAGTEIHEEGRQL